MSAPPAVTIEHWAHPRLAPPHPLADRWSVMDGERALLTFSSEIEARKACREHGWIVTRTDEGAMFAEGAEL